MDSKKLDFVHLRFEIIVWLNKLLILFEVEVLLKPDTQI